MKIAGIIIAILLFLLSGLVGVLGANKAFDAADTISSLTEGMSDAEKDAMDAAGIPSAGRLKFGGIVGGVGALAAIAVIVLLFVKRPLALKVGGAAVALCLVSVVLYPGMETGAADGMAPRTQAIVALVMAMIGSAGAFMVKKSES